MRAFGSYLGGLEWGLNLGFKIILEQEPHRAGRSCAMRSGLVYCGTRIPCGVAPAMNRDQRQLFVTLPCRIHFSLDKHCEVFYTWLGDSLSPSE